MNIRDKNLSISVHYPPCNPTPECRDVLIGNRQDAHYHTRERYLPLTNGGYIVIKEDINILTNKAEALPK